MITNCPNCGAPLDGYGHCSYCGTNVVQNIEILSGNRFANAIELNLVVSNSDGTKFVLPLVGHINNVELTPNYYDISGFDGQSVCCSGTTDVEFTFSGSMRRS